MCMPELGCVHMYVHACSMLSLTLFVLVFRLFFSEVHFRQGTNTEHFFSSAFKQMNMELSLCVSCREVDSTLIHSKANF